MEIYKCCFTGYRPSKLPFLNNKDGEDFIEFENSIISVLTKLINENCIVFYTGMAMGFDIIAAETVLLMKKIYKDKDIRLISVLPFENQNDSFDDEWKKRFDNIIKNCDEKIILSQNYYKGCYQKRNKYMVDNSDFVITWFDGQKGGTKNTLDYAAKKKRQIFNISKIQSDEYSFQEKIDI